MKNRPAETLKTNGFYNQRPPPLNLRKESKKMAKNI